MEYRVTVKQVTPWSRALNAARLTVNKEALDKEPSNKWKAQMLLAEHSDSIESETKLWVDICGYEDCYEVNKDGIVRSKTRFVNSRSGKRIVLGKEIKPCTTKFGYKFLHLYKNNKSKPILVHRLVWESFNGKIPDGLTINHKNEIKSDNRLCNLELLTSKDNTNYGTRNRRASIAMTNNPLRSKIILQMDSDDNVVAEYPSGKECQRSGFNRRHVIACCNGIEIYHKGYKWRFKNECIS